jgi:cytochrome c oxidase cbb3-type subunit 3
MSDFTSDFWSPAIMFVVLASFLACLVLLLLTSRTPLPTPDNTTGHVWDGDLREANNPVPRWWSGLFILTILFALIYLALYPGLGDRPGATGWTSQSQYENERQALDAEIAPLYARFQSRPIPELVRDPEALALGERLFLNYCAQCHGSTGTGSKGFPNLTDNDWLYGNAPEQIVATLRHGRQGAMPPMAAAVGSSQDVERLAHYVLSLSGPARDPVKAALGRSQFSACAACHGPDGRGNQAIGAPNLTDSIWLHGSGLQAITTMINQGKNNVMPAWEHLLSEGQIHVLAAYVLSLSANTP